MKGDDKMITKTVNEVNLSITYNKGKDDKGKDILKSQRFKNVNLNLGEDVLYEMGKSLSDLINYRVISIDKEENSVLSKDSE